MAISILGDTRYFREAVVIDGWCQRRDLFLAETAALAAKEETLKIEPMSEIEKAYMDLKGKLAAAEARVEALEIKAATWLALASPIWVGDESEGHFVCLACNQAGTDDGGCKTIQHLPDCEYAAALAAKPSTPKPPVPEPQIVTTGWPADKEPPNG
jgi:hypothetical protein